MQLAGGKWILLSRMGQTNTFSNTLVQKNRVRHGKNIYFTRVVFTLVAKYTIIGQGKTEIKKLEYKTLFAGSMQFLQR